MRSASYYSYTHISDPTNGISRKVVSHAESLRKLDYETTLYGITFAEGFSEGVTGRALGSCLFFLRAGFGMLAGSRKNLVLVRNPDSGIGLLFFWFFLIVARLNSDKMILDVPSYPYDRELVGLRRNIGLAVHRLQRPLFSNVFDFITYTGEECSRIWGCRTERLYNSSLTTFSGRREPEGDVTTFVCMANLMYWHGFDRLISGLSEYGGKDVVIWFFGEGEPELSRLKCLVEKRGLSENVVFWGKKDIAEIAALVPGGAIGVDSLGRHRSGNNYNDSIKSKDYIALGIPVIKSHRDDSIDKVSFVYTVGADETPIDIASIISWKSELQMLDLSCFEEFTRHNSYVNQFKKIL